MTHFRTICTVRIALLCATIYLFFYLLFQTTNYATFVIVGGIALYQIYALVHYVERTNRDLTRFLQAIRYEDFSQSFAGPGLGSSFDDLKAAFNEVLDAFRRTRAEREENFQYLQIVIQHVGIGLICFQPGGNVELMNAAARRLLKVGALKNITALASFSKPLVDTLFRLKPGEKALVKIEENNEPLQLAVYATELRMRDQAFTLVSIQNIQNELEEKEMEAWQNLIRVLTHEILNSVTPIASLASTVNDLLTATDASDHQKLKGEIRTETIGDIHDAVQTIERRSQGLLNFVDAYRKLTRIPKPDFRIFPVAELLARVQQLMRAKMRDRAIDFHIRVEPETLELSADPEQIEQVLINLLLNAMQALEGRSGPRIDLTSRMDGRGRVVIQVRDNGPGILEEVQKKIFIPFFTTKQDGSGIGLSLSRQMMRLHGGTINVRSRPDVETVFTLRF